MLVSCITPTYNRRDYLPRAIDLFLRQDYSDRELIILDDGTDDVRDLIPNDPSILHHRGKVQAKHFSPEGGPVQARWDPRELDGRLPLDESAQCYKSCEEVVSAVVAAGLARVEHSGRSLRSATIRRLRPKSFQPRKPRTISMRLA